FRLVRVQQRGQRQLVEGVVFCVQAAPVLQQLGADLGQLLLARLFVQLAGARPHVSQALVGRALDAAQGVNAALALGVFGFLFWCAGVFGRGLGGVCAVTWISHVFRPGLRTQLGGLALGLDAGRFADLPDALLLGFVDAGQQAFGVCAGLFGDRLAAVVQLRR